MSTALPLTRADCLALDQTDILAPLREQFALPAGTIYLDGNSLGVLPKATAGRVQQAVTAEFDPARMHLAHLGDEGGGAGIGLHRDALDSIDLHVDRHGWLQKTLGVGCPVTSARFRTDRPGHGR